MKYSDHFLGLALPFAGQTRSRNIEKHVVGSDGLGQKSFSCSRRSKQKYPSHRLSNAFEKLRHHPR